MTTTTTDTTAPRDADETRDNVRAGHFGENADFGWWAVCWDDNGRDYGGTGLTRTEAVNAALDKRWQRVG